jgi:hypothetical protein
VAEHAPAEGETKDALDEIAGAWGGKPDTVLLLKMLADDRSQVRFPKVRWAKRGKRPAVLLAFDADTEGFTYLGEESEEERDYLAEIRAFLLTDPAWRTSREIGATREKGGIGADQPADYEPTSRSQTSVGRTASSRHGFGDFNRSGLLSADRRPDHQIGLWGEGLGWLVRGG